MRKNISRAEIIESQIYAIEKEKYNLLLDHLMGIIDSEEFYIKNREMQEKIIKYNSAR